MGSHIGLIRRKEVKNRVEGGGSILDIDAGVLS
jgi:hypothetical protein